MAAIEKIPSDFHKRLRAARGYAGHPKIEWAKLLGSSRPTIDRWEDHEWGAPKARRTLPRATAAAHLYAQYAGLPIWFFATPDIANPDLSAVFPPNEQRKAT